MSLGPNHVTANWSAFSITTNWDRLNRQLEDSASQSAEDETAGIKVQTRYMNSGTNSYQLVSNPYRAAYSSSAGSEATIGWTRTKSDKGGRVLEAQTFSGSGLPSPWGSNSSHSGIVTTSYDAQFTTVAEQAGKARRSKVDGLGRLIRVDEPDSSGSLGTTSAPAQPTSYVYDVAGNLKTVTQGVQTRTFVYSSLSRLTSATNPESGTISYVYDNNGNLTRKTDPRLYIDYVYDALSRVATRTYSDGTPTVTYTYDAGSVTNSKGRLTSMSSSVSTTNYTAYDTQGRITASNQVTDGQTYSISHTYNLAGNLVSMTYPSGRIITTEYDSAGRMAGIRHQQSGTYLAGGAATDATNRMQYAAHGAVSVTKIGNGLWEHTNFNSRLQPVEIGLGTSSTSSSTLGLTYNYGTTDNNGNVLSVSYAGGGLSYTQTFGYDNLNRLTTSQEGPAWSQTNSYDRYGNRSVVGGGLSFNAANNRITNAGYVYDAAGNLTNDGVHSYGFDGENKIKSVDGVNDVYRYDGDGNRVRKNFAAGEKVRMVYNGGHLIAEYDLSSGALLKEYVYGGKGLIATIEPGAGTKYTTADHLGTPRVVTSSTGSVISRHDYKPFGEEIGAGTGGRNTGTGFSIADGVRQKFTSKERDNEVGLDYFLARYYSATQGRFVSSDKPLADQFQANPQSWNLYSYVRNSPCNNIDAKGRCSAPTGLQPGQTGICIEAFIAAKTFMAVGFGDNRGFSGDDATLTAKFTTQIVITPSADGREAYVFQRTTAGITRFLNPAVIPTGSPIVAVPGTAETTLNGTKSAADGSSNITVPIDNNGVARINASTTAENGLSAFTGIAIGTIRTAINVESTVSTGQVKLDAGSLATGYPSMAIYSYAHVGGKIVTTEVWKQEEGEPAALREPMKPLPDQTEPRRRY